MLIWAVLVFASAGVLSHSGIKIPYFTFFGHDSGKRPKEAPFHMLLAMGLTAFLCIAIGVFPDPLYALLPYEVDYKPYTPNHVVGQMQLLCFALLAFVVLMKSGLHPPEIRSVNLDTDWTYRKAAPSIMLSLGRGLGELLRSFESALTSLTKDSLTWLERTLGPEGGISAGRPLGIMALWIVILLALALIVGYI